MNAFAIILEAPQRLSVRQLALHPVTADDVVVDIAFSGISSGTEKLLWNGEMPAFPGMGYPLVPGYESVGRVVDAGENATDRIGDWVFVPGASCYRDAKGLFGGTAERVVVPSVRTLSVPQSLGSSGILLALAATAMHAFDGGEPPDLIVGHGVLGRLLARITIARGAPAPVVWETNPKRRDSNDYAVIDPASDDRLDYRSVIDVSGSDDAIDVLVPRIARGGEIALAGFYSSRMSFAFPAAFQKEATVRIAAEFTPADLAATSALIETGALKLDGLISDVRPARQAETAYPAAFNDPDCLKMVLDWSEAA